MKQNKSLLLAESALLEGSVNFCKNCYVINLSSGLNLNQAVMLNLFQHPL